MAKITSTEHCAVPGVQAQGWGPGAPLMHFIQGAGWDHQCYIRNKPLPKPAEEQPGIEPTKTATKHLQTPNRGRTTSQSYFSSPKILRNKV